jgi:Calcineurin-like phosphoesterase/Purple acid Phosphatase, N-terminal domain
MPMVRLHLSTSAPAGTSRPRRRGRPSLARGGHILLACVLVQGAVAAVAVARPGSASAALPGARKMLTRAPYLTDLTSNSVRINWATRLQRRGMVRFGRAGHPLTRVVIDRHRGSPITINGVREFQSSVLIRGLAPNTAYRYRVFATGGKRLNLLGSNPSPRFTTLLRASAARPFTFDVMGDWGDTTNSAVNNGRLNRNQARLDALIAASGARFMLSVGDTAYPGGTQTDYGDLNQTGVNISAVFGPSYWAKPGQHIPYFSVSGNHGRNGTYLFDWPETSTVHRSHGTYALRFYPAIDGTKPNRYPTSYYAFSTGGVRFYMLDASWGDNNAGRANGGACGRRCAIYQVDHDAHWRPHSPELRWLKRDLAAHRGVMKIAVWHFPLYSDNSTEPGDPYLDGAGRLEGLLHNNGVKLVFNGHAHDYQRNIARPGGIVSYVTGGGGGKVQPVGTGSIGCAGTDAYAVGWAYRSARGSACGGAAPPSSDSQVYNFLRVTVHGRTVTVRPINALGQAFDVQTYHF